MLWLFAFVCLLSSINAQLSSEAHPAPEPYAFAYSAENDDGSSSAREESGDAEGRVTGFYILNGLDGQARRVDYVADENGFRATVSTNEIGTETQNPNPADVDLRSSAPTAAELVAQWEAANPTPIRRVVGGGGGIGVRGSGIGGSAVLVPGAGIGVGGGGGIVGGGPVAVAPPLVRRPVTAPQPPAPAFGGGVPIGGTILTSLGGLGGGRVNVPIAAPPAVSGVNQFAGVRQPALIGAARGVGIRGGVVGAASPAFSGIGVGAPSVGLIGGRRVVGGSGVIGTNELGPGIGSSLLVGSPGVSRIEALRQQSIGGLGLAGVGGFGGAGRLGTGGGLVFSVIPGGSSYQTIGTTFDGLGGGLAGGLRGGYGGGIGGVVVPSGGISASNLQNENVFVIPGVTARYDYLNAAQIPDLASIGGIGNGLSGISGSATRASGTKTPLPSGLQQLTLSDDAIAEDVPEERRRSRARKARRV